MVSPISALDSRAPRVQAPTRVAPVVAKASAEEASTTPNASAAGPAPVLSPGARDALPAGYRNLALPLGASASGTETVGARGAASDSPLLAAYGPSEVALAALPRLAGDRLPVRAVLREAQAAIRERAEAKGETAAEFLDAAPIVASAKLPSRNGADAEATLRASLLARVGERETAALDIYLTKTGPTSFEAVTYDRDFAAPSGGFPYSAPPLSCDRFLFDPACEAIAAAAGLPTMRATGRRAGTERMSLGEAALASAIVATTLVVVALSLGADRPLAAAAFAAIGLCGLGFALRSRLFR